MAIIASINTIATFWMEIRDVPIFTGTAAGASSIYSVQIKNKSCEHAQVRTDGHGHKNGRSTCMGPV